MTEDEISRFWEKVNKDGPVVRPELGNCWVWTASKRNGYGCYSIKRKAKQAHRLSYELEYGELPALLRHRCDNKPCVRPDHLEPGTEAQNALDMLQRDPRFVDRYDIVVQARRMAAAGHSIHAIAKTLDADRKWLIAVIQGTNFGHVDEPTVDLREIYRPIYYKLSDEQYAEILDALSRPYHGQGKQLAEKYGVHPSLITLIKKRKLKTIRGASQN